MEMDLLLCLIKKTGGGWNLVQLVRPFSIMRPYVIVAGVRDNMEFSLLTTIIFQTSDQM